MFQSTAFQSQGIPEALRAEFDREIRARTARGVWAVSLIAFFLFPVTTVLDWITYPDVFGPLSAVRFSTSGFGFAFVGLLWWLRKRGLAERFARASAWGFIIICCAGLDGLILTAGGPESPYYAGLTLLLLAVLVSMPFGPLEMTVVLLFITLQFNLVMVLLDELTDWLLYLNANYFFVSTIAIGLFGTWASHRLRIQEFLTRALIEEEKARSEALLLNILPEEVADELKARGRVEARKIKRCTILFSDFVGFTSLSERADPAALVRCLDQAFSRFDSIMSKWGLEKLKTIGDAYMCAGGVLVDQPDHLVACILAGMEMLDALEEEGVTAPDGSRWKMRLGVHSGPVVAGVIGSKKFAYDLWGDTVNTASRLESSGQPGSVNVMSEVYDEVSTFFEGVDRGFVTVRGKGPVAMTQVRRLRAEYSADGRGRVPNDAFYSALDAWVENSGSDAQLPRIVTPQPLVGDPSPSFDPLRTFSVLTYEDRESLMKIARRVPVQAGRALIEEGQGLSVLFLVLDGLLGVRMQRDDVDIQVAVIGPGEIVGELSFVSLEPASATVVGLSDGEVLRFDLDELQALTGELPGTGARLFHSLALVLARRVREANARLFTVVTPQARLEQVQAVPTPAPVQIAILALRAAVDAGAGIAEAMDGLVQRFATHIAEDPASAGFVGATVLRETYALMMRSPLLASCHQHVDGCASDHAAMDAVAEGASRQNDPVARALDAWFLGLAPAVALREGFDAVATQLKNRAARAEGAWRVADLCAGAAPAVFAALSDGEARVTCVDRDLDDLTFLGARARELGIGERFTLIRADVQLPARLRGRLRLVPQDFAFITAMTQELSDEQFVELLDEVHRLLLPGGRFIVGQLRLDPALRAFFAHVVDWQIHTRDADALFRCARESRFGRGEIIRNGRWHGLELVR